MPVAGTTLDALESLYRTDFPHFVRTAAAIAGTTEDAGRDAVQEAFAQAVRKRASFRHEASLETWLWRIVINEALALRRKSERQAERGWECPASLSTSHEPERDAAVRAWVASLPDRQRIAVFLRYFVDLDYRSIANVLDVEVGTVSATLATAHAAFRRSYEEAVQ